MQFQQILEALKFNIIDINHVSKNTSINQITKNKDRLSLILKNKNPQIQIYFNVFLNHMNLLLNQLQNGEVNPDFVDACFKEVTLLEKKFVISKEMILNDLNKIYSKFLTITSSKFLIDENFTKNSLIEYDKLSKQMLKIFDNIKDNKNNFKFSDDFNILLITINKKLNGILEEIILQLIHRSQLSKGTQVQYRLNIKNGDYDKVIREDLLKFNLLNPMVRDSILIKLKNVLSGLNELMYMDMPNQITNNDNLIVDDPEMEQYRKRAKNLEENLIASGNFSITAAHKLNQINSLITDYETNSNNNKKK